MKKIIFTLLLAIPLASTGFAQTLKGSKMIGGDGYLSFDDAFYANLNPNIGYFPLDDLAVGIKTPINFGSHSGGRFKYITGDLAPFVRYYFGKPTRFRVFAEGSGGIGYARNKSERNESYSVGYIRNSIGGSLGTVYFITEQVGLEAQLNYRNYKSGYKSSSENFIADSRRSNTTITLGIQVHLPTSKKE
ncbi:hypothetical protein ACMA1I_22985 [Pontibacter sp. 13R65]|uniref:hypothetical protein n=1 Tax=Pontibacter sp. 13R65 TaxID=3127458 RepID=UPI00301CB512